MTIYEFLNTFDGCYDKNFNCYGNREEDLIISVIDNITGEIMYNTNISLTKCIDSNLNYYDIYFYSEGVSFGYCHFDTFAYIAKVLFFTINTETKKVHISVDIKDFYKVLNTKNFYKF